MMNLRIARSLAVGLIVVLGLSGLAQARSKDEVTASIRARAGELQAAKAAGKIGEVWNGTVEAVKPDAAAAKTVAGENADRQELFQIIAKEKGSSAAAVGEAWGTSMIGRAQRGEWVKKKGAAGWEQVK